MISRASLAYYENRVTFGAASEKPEILESV